MTSSEPSGDHRAVVSDRLLIFSLCLAEALGMLGISTFPMLLPELQAEWGLSNSQAGWITGI